MVQRDNFLSFPWFKSDTHSTETNSQIVNFDSTTPKDYTYEEWLSPKILGRDSKVPKLSKSVIPTWGETTDGNFSRLSS